MSELDPKPVPGEERLSFSELLALAVRLHQEGRLAEAEEMYQRILTLVPDQADALHFLGLLRHQSGKSQEAVDLLRRAVASAPDYADAYNNLGNVLQLQGRLEEATAALRQVIQLRPDHVAAHNNLGIVLKDQGDLEGAIRAFHQAIALRPDHAQAFHNLGVALRAQGKTEEAARAWTQAVTLQPDLANAWHQLGVLHNEQGRTEEAQATFERVTRLNEGHAAAHLELAHLLRKQGASNQAVDAYRRALALNPHCQSARQFLAVILDVLGRKEEAKQVWSDWLSLAPQHPIARHMFAAAEGAPAPERAEDDYVRAVFDDFADRFERHLEHLEYRAPHLVAEAVAAALPPPQSALVVLDAGCGTGWCGPLVRPYAAKLVGVDLSPAMLDKARTGRGYDTLVEAELTGFLSQASQEYDLIISADTLVYFGNLEPVCDAAHHALKPGGLLVFTLEARDAARPSDAGYTLHSRGRYCHDKDYVERALTKAGLRVSSINAAPLRREAWRDVAGWVVTACK